MQTYIFFGWMSEDLYNRRGCLKHFEHFSFFIFIKFHWQIICYLRKEGRGHCFSKLIFWYKYEDRVNLWIWRYKPPSHACVITSCFPEWTRKNIYVLCMWTFSRDDSFIHRNVCPTSRRPGRRSVTCRLQHSVSDTDTCTWIIHLWTCQLCIWVTV